VTDPVAPTAAELAAMGRIPPPTPEEEAMILRVLRRTRPFPRRELLSGHDLRRRYHVSATCRSCGGPFLTAGRYCRSCTARP
jgi:hypothetical protein